MPFQDEVERVRVLHPKGYDYQLTTNIKTLLFYTVNETNIGNQQLNEGRS